MGKVLEAGTLVNITYVHFHGVDGSVVCLHSTTNSDGNATYMIKFEDTKVTPPLNREMALVENVEFDVINYIPVKIMELPFALTHTGRWAGSPLNVIQARITMGVYNNNAYYPDRNDVITAQNRKELIDAYKRVEGYLNDLFRDDVVEAYSHLGIDREYLSKLFKSIWDNSKEYQTLNEIVEQFDDHISLLKGFKVVKADGS